MSKVVVTKVLFSATPAEMAEWGFEIVPSEEGTISWRTGGGTILTVEDGSLTVEGSVPSALQSFEAAGGTILLTCLIDVEKGSLPVEAYRDLIRGMAEVPPHPTTRDGEAWERLHQEHHAAREAVWDKWEATKAAVHG
jgi:hypothetical protein